MSVVLTKTGDLDHTDEGGKKKYSSSLWEIEEEEEEDNLIELLEVKNVDPLPSIKEEVDGISLFSFDFRNSSNDDVVYVAVGKPDSSMGALVWTLNHAVTDSSTLVFLIHVFPELRYIPTPLGNMPISKANPEQKQDHMVQERSKRREFLQKFIDVCCASKVKVDTILIESDKKTKALLDLIPILNIRKLVLGTSKSSLRKLRSRKGNGIAEKVLQTAPEFCEVKVICQGKEVVADSMSEPPSPSGSSDSSKSANIEEKDQRNDSFSFTCFKSKVIA